MVSTIGVEKARLYDKYRLPYAAEMADGLLGYIGGAPVIADIGAGTGQLARLFARQSAKIYAVEPDPAMRQVGAAALAGFPNVEFLAGCAEQTTCAENSIDLIVVGNAFQRFRPEACGEFRRILRPPGWIALIAYSFTNRAFADMLFPKLAALKGVAARIDQSWHRTPIKNLFEGQPTQTLSYHQSHTEDWTAFFGAARAGIKAPERTDPEYEQFEALNRKVFNAFAVDGKIQIEYETQVTFGQLKRHGQATR